MPDDYSASIQTTGAVTVGGVTTGDIEKRRDVDWFAVELAAGRTYVIDLEGADSGGGTLRDTILRGLYDGGGNLIAGTRDRNGGEGDDARLTFTASESGTYYIAARGQGADTGTYTVRVTPADADAAAAGATDLGDLAVLDGVQAHRGKIDGEADGADYYRFTLSEAKKVDLTLRGQDANADLYLEGADGAVLSSSAKGGTGNERIEETLQAGTYYVRVAAQEAGDNAYVLRAAAADVQPSIPEPPPQEVLTKTVAPVTGTPVAIDDNKNQPQRDPPDDYSSDTGTTGAVTVGGVATGDIEKRRDVDWFAVELAAGRTYVIGLEGADSGGGTLGDTILRGLYDGEGNLIAGTRDRDGGKGDDARLTFTASESGTYYIAARGQGADTGTYTVRVTPADADAVAAGATDLGDLAVLDGVQAHRGKIDGGADGADYYRFTLSEAKRVDLTLRGQDANADLYLEGADGAVLSSSAKGGTGNERIDETLQAGTYYVRVAAQEAGDNAYVLRAAAADVQPSVPEPPPQEVLTKTVAPVTGTPVAILDYSDPQWADRSFDYGKGWAGRGFGLTGTQRGAPEEIEIAEVDGVKALRFNPADRNQAWYDEHPNAVDHEVYGKADRSSQDDLFLYGSHWTTGDDPYLIAQVHLGSSRDGNFISLRMPVKFESGSGNEARSWPGIFYYDDWIKLRGPGREDIKVRPPSHEGEGWVTLGMTVTDSGDIIYVGKYGTHTLAELFSEPDFECRNSVISRVSDSSYFPVARQNDGTGMFSQRGSDNAIAYIEYGTNLAVDADWMRTGALVIGDGSEPDGTDFSADTSTQGRVAVGGSVMGEIETPDDRDWFAVELEAGKTYRIDLRGPSTGEGTLFDPYLSGIYDAGGSFIAGTADDHGGAGRNSRVSFTADKDATYYVEATTGKSITNYGNGTYTLAVEEVVDAM